MGMRPVLVGKRRLPCDHHGVRLDMEPGEFTRTCPTCRKAWHGELEWSVAWTKKMGGRPTLVLRWKDGA